MKPAGGRTSEVRIEAFDPVHQAVLSQKLQGPVDRDGSRRMPLCVAEPIDDLVGADGRMAAGDNLEDATPALGQPCISPRALLLRPRHQQGKTSSVIVITFRGRFIVAYHRLPERR